MALLFLLNYYSVVKASRLKEIEFFKSNSNVIDLRIRRYYKSMELKLTEIYEYVKSITKKHETVCKYLNGKIYKLSSPNLDKYYIGSTTQSLKERLRLHVKDFVNYNNKKRKYGNTSFKIIEAEDYKIELIENFPRTSKTQLEKREGWYHRKYRKIGRAHV